MYIFFPSLPLYGFREITNMVTHPNINENENSTE